MAKKTRSKGQSETHLIIRRAGKRDRQQNSTFYVKKRAMSDIKSVEKCRVYKFTKNTNKKEKHIRRPSKEGVAQSGCTTGVIAQLQYAIA